MSSNREPADVTQAPKLKSTELPEVDDNEDLPPFGNIKPDFLSTNPEYSDLTPQQLYELNQSFLEESVPTRPLIDVIVPIAVLRAEYENGSASFVKQIDSLMQQGYSAIRRTRGDGDCFYRSLAFSYVERVLRAADPALAAASAMSVLDSALPLLRAAGFEQLVYEDFYEVLVSLIREVGDPSVTPPMTLDRLLEAFQSAETSNSIVVFLRLLTSARIRTDTEAYAPFLMHPDFGVPMEPREFCESFVEATGKEADHVQIIALSRALHIDVDIAYLDGRSETVDFVQFHNTSDGIDPLILLYRPGHYDIFEKNVAK